MAGKFLRHDACPRCGSLDNLVVYLSEVGNETSSCMTPGCGYMVTDKDYTMTHYELPALEDITENGRALDAAYLKKFGIGASGSKVYFPYYNDRGIAVGAKVRDFSKAKDEEYHFTIQGAITSELFGKQCANGKNVAICFGEFDAVAVSQATGGWISGVSVPNGDNGALKAIKKNVSWLSGFDNIYLVPDQDKSGLSVVDAIVSLLPSIKVVTLQHKDANDVLINGKPDELKSAFFAASKQRPRYISSGVDDALDYIFNADSAVGFSTGITQLDTLLGGGLRAGEVTVLMAPPGRGKSTFSYGAIGAALRADKKVLYHGTEERVGRALVNIASVYHGHPISAKTHTKEEVKELLSVLDDKLFFLSFDERPNDDDLYKMVSDLCTAEDISLYVLDTVSNDYGQDLTSGVNGRMVVINNLVNRRKIHALVVTHTGRDGASDDGFDKTPDLRQGFGSSALERLAWNFIALALHGDDQLYLYVLKNRKFGADGCGSFRLKFNKQTRSYCDVLIHKNKEDVVNAKDDSPPTAAPIPVPSSASVPANGDTSTDAGERSTAVDAVYFDTDSLLAEVTSIDYKHWTKDKVFQVIEDVVPVMYATQEDNPLYRGWAEVIESIYRTRQEQLTKPLYTAPGFSEKKDSWMKKHNSRMEVRRAKGKVTPETSTQRRVLRQQAGGQFVEVEPHAGKMQAQVGSNSDRKVHSRLPDSRGTGSGTESDNGRIVETEMPTNVDTKQRPARQVSDNLRSGQTHQRQPRNNQQSVVRQERSALHRGGRAAATLPANRPTRPTRPSANTN